MKRNARRRQRSRPELVLSFSDMATRMRRSVVVVYGLALAVALFVEVALKAQAFFDGEPILFWLGPLLAGALFILLARWAAKERLAALSSRADGSAGRLLAGLAVGVGLLAWLLLADSTLARVFPSVYSGYRGHPELYRAPLLLVALPGAGLLLPVGEEVLFRGLLQSTLAGRYRAWVAIAIVALLYGVRALDPLLFFSNLGAGLVLGWACRRFSLTTAIAAHVVANLGLLALGFALL